MSNDERTLRPPDRQYAAPPFSTQTTSQLGQNHAQMLGMLRDVRAEVQNLQAGLQELVDKEKMADLEMRVREVLATLRANQPIYDYNSKQVNARLVELRTLTRIDPSLYDLYGDEITHIENFWERATYDWPLAAALETAEKSLQTGVNVVGATVTPAAEFTESAPTEAKKSASKTNSKEDTKTPPPASADDALARKVMIVDDLLRRSTRAVENLDKLVYHAGLLTIPARLNQHLEQLRIGQKLDFNETFKDEVPQVPDRQRILDYLAARPVAVNNAIIDAASGAVFHASSSAARRRLSYVFIIGTVLAGALLVYITSQLGEWFDLENWVLQPHQTVNMLVGYGFTLVGGIVHIGVDAIKQARSRSSNGSLLAIDDWLLWVHINESGIIIGIVSLWIGFFGLLFFTGGINWETAFLIGYSVDSFIDLFLERFNTLTSSRITKIKI